jgi:hypothetical protein
MLKHYQKNSASHAVPAGSSASSRWKYL